MLNNFIVLATKLLARTRIFTVALLLVLSGTTGWAQYCSSGATSTFDSNCGGVVFNTINNSTLGICATYTDFTSISTNVTVGNSYPISVTAGTCGGDYSKSCKVYIDYNQDQDFLDPGEEVFSAGPVTPTTVLTGNVTIPGTALLGSTRMRVVVEETSSPNNVASCGTYTWGETEDYTVVIAPSSPNDIGLTGISAPTSGCNLSANEQVSISVTNFGTNVQNAWTVSFSVNGVVQATEPMTGPLASAATVPYTFTATANLATPGTYTIQAWTTMVGDTIPFNDTITTVVTSIPGVTTYPYIEDFESGNGGWIPGGTNSSWAFGTPAKNTIIGAASGVNSYVTGGLGTGDYNSNEDSEVIGPCFDFSSLQNPWISLSVWWNSESSWDGSNLQYSTDFGVTWNNVGAFGDPGNWYNQQNVISQPGGQGDAWCGRTSSQNGSNGWLTAAHRLDGLAGLQSVRLRVTFGSDGSVQDDGFAFDDIRISEGPVVDLGSDTLICGGDTLYLDAGNFATYQWSNGPQSQVDTITTGGTFAVIVTDTNGFYDFDTIQVGFSTPIVNVGPDSTICPGDTVVLDAGVHPGGSFLWSNSGNTQTQPFTTAGTHFVTVTDSVGCETSDSMTITVAIPPSLNLGPDQTVCASQPVTLNAGTGPVGTVYNWNTGATSQILVVTSPGTYAASVTTPGGCAAIDTIVVNNFPSPGANLGPDRVECGPYTLDAGAGGTSYLWSNNSTSQTVNLNMGGTYSVTVTNQFSCTGVDSVTISMGTPPPVNLGANQTLCNGQSITLNAGNPGSTYNWSNGATTQTISVTTPGLYIVEVTAPSGCAGSDTVNIAGSALSVNLGQPQDICGNGFVILDAGNPGNNYSWNTGATTQTISVSTPGSYSVTVTDPAGCDAVASTNVGQLPGITAGINSPATANLFQNIQFNDASSPTPSSWEWDFGDGSPVSTQQNPTHTFVSLGTFTVRLIADDGQCRDTTTTQVEVNNYVGVGEEDFAAAMELYPNPSDGVFHLYLELFRPRDLEIAVTDLSGKVMFQKNERNAFVYKGDIDLSGIARGVYILRLSTGDRTTYKKLVLK
jgi:hypothetical protein